ncbi:bis(5'-nucleosyl)-tetraphosphatase (symmetrical) YqeK [Bacillus mobilis]|uniref:bis(5'-nucleosyl)-tetraphosphatase (symmetrical) n=2 Tax=Bacillus cereus group TaxID=86661 RepID=A0A1C4CKF6_BACCE|nr:MULTISPECIES: bis(5'-nucleosyl)-tetraphosphatase (symmetrical) YqeK [Bacillus cereus group]MCU5436310.1 bis(5'-nucleosyl)-tetraphosphatase (symmetrical) YqeK [Bacillus mobilis]MCU5595946.1 bis(5'-nucleosyl)-tetraphosphatase (symmetrical) YqeK [Bacillus mobilis]MCU5739552.1 bis(5'-nucleosyl)-tetraphosphatase (symmetrical) YqeK [Bacillus mobilis]MCU9562122.1 bis(5'-nucleosyl)-tetraphosphatase (symmetrical) YqeK [Bacillus mobilis]OKA37552.1 HAD family hydrolase [Bacillus cereus]
MLNKDIYSFTPTGKIENDIKAFLLKYSKEVTYKHSIRVANEARKIAITYHVNEEKAAIAAYLHDISAIFPNEERVAVAEQFRIEILQEEREFPMIIHQKLSRIIAKEIFKVDDEEILNAINCHTTLRKHATKMDLVLFVADKIEWDHNGTPPYLVEVKKGLEKSLEHAAFSYISYLWDRKDTLKVLHPWLDDAYWQLKEIVE